VKGHSKTGIHQMFRFPDRRGLERRDCHSIIAIKIANRSICHEALKKTSNYDVVIARQEESTSQSGDFV
jgi:hypothetical protein